MNTSRGQSLHKNQVTNGTMVQVAALQDYITEKVQIHDGFVSEFNKLPTETSSMHVSQLPRSMLKNRYTNLWTYDHNRVLLKTDRDNPSDYINASHIRGYDGRAYIASQGPTNATISDTWRMIWQLNTNRVVMLTRLSDCGMSICELYWPSDIGSKEDYGQFTVTTLSCEIYSDYTIRTFLITYQRLANFVPSHCLSLFSGTTSTYLWAVVEICELIAYVLLNAPQRSQEASRQVTHFHFTAWVDEGVPKHTYPLLAFRRLVRSHDDRNTGTMIVHCSAGVGRTGTFIALDSLLDQGKAEGQIDVFGFTHHLRNERMEMVEMQDQYVFLHHALLDGLQTGHLSYHVSEYQDIYKRLCVDDEHVTELKQQFQLLESLKAADTEHSGEGQKNDKQWRKQRCPDTKPVNAHLRHQAETSLGPGHSVNAVCVDSFRRRNGYLLTEMPLADATDDFWHLVYDRRCPTIITLDMVESQAHIDPWPCTDDPVHENSELTVTLLGERNSDVEDIIEREFSVYFTAKPSKAHTVRQYQLTSTWPKDDRLPSCSNTFLKLIEMVNRPGSHHHNNSGPVIIQCIDGASRCGLLCAASHLLGSLTVDQYVDVFHSVQHVRNNRPDAIDCLDQYKFLHRLAAEFQEGT